MDRELKIIQQYFPKVKDINQSKVISVLPLTIADMMLEYYEERTILNKAKNNMDERDYKSMNKGNDELPYFDKPTKVVIEFEEYDYTGTSNDIYGTVTKVNGVELSCHNSDYPTIVQQILEHLGYEVEIDVK